MSRRGLSFALLAILAVQLFGGVAMASVCLEPCPEDGDETSCPPACALCTTCRHAQPAIVQAAAGPSRDGLVRRASDEQTDGMPSPPADDIFHVPLSA